MTDIKTMHFTRQVMFKPVKVRVVRIFFLILAPVLEYDII